MSQANIMNVTGLQFLANEAMKLATAAIGISKSLAKKCLKLQFNIAIFPFIFAYGGIMYVSKWFIDSDNENVPPLQPPSAVVCGRARELRNTALSSMIAINSSRCQNVKHASRENQNKRKYEKNLHLDDLNVEDRYSMENFDGNGKVASMKLNDFSGRDLLWDIPIIAAKSKYFAQSVKEERDDDVVEARNALEQHPLEAAVPETREIFNDMKNKGKEKQEISESSVIEVRYAETRHSDNCNANECVDSDSFEGKYRQKKEVCSYDASRRISPKRKIKCLYNPLLTQGKMCREVSTVNKTLGKIQATCSRLLGELSNLTDALSKVISMKEKLTNLEFQVDEGKRLLQEVECDRFIMKSKLLALEKLINEEEKFLSGDGSCESGFYESVESTDGF